MGDIVVPAHLRVLGAEAERLHAWLAARMEAPGSGGGLDEACMPEVCKALMQRLDVALRSLADVLNGPVGAEAGRVDGSEAAVLRAVGRLEQALEQLLAVYADAGSLSADMDDDYPKQLLLDGLRDILEQVDTVLVCLADMIKSPEGFTEPGTVRDGDRVELPLNLKLEAPEAFIELTRFWQSAVIEPGHHGERRHWWGVAGAAVLGALLGGSVFGDGCSR